MRRAAPQAPGNSKRGLRSKPSALEGQLRSIDWYGVGALQIGLAIVESIKSAIELDPPGNDSLERAWQPYPHESFGGCGDSWATPAAAAA